jgi:lipopolysaccharide export system protein LptA
MSLSMPKFRINCISLLVLILASKLSLAMPDDREKIIELSADSADLNQQTHRGEYIGSVQFDQGTTHLRATKAVTKGDKQNKLVFAIANGNEKEQAHYWEQTAIDKPLLHAYADIIRYYPNRHLIELIGNARVSQGDSSFAAPQISYDTLKQHVFSKSDGKTRVTIVVHPGKQP